MTRYHKMKRIIKVLKSQAKKSMNLNKNYQPCKPMKEREYSKIHLSLQFLLQTKIDLLTTMLIYRLILILIRNQHLPKVRISKLIITKNNTVIR